MKSIEVGDTVRVVANYPGAKNRVGRVGCVVELTPFWVDVALESGAERFGYSEVAPIHWNVGVRKVEDSWWVASRSTAAGALSVEGAFITHDFAMDYARQLAIRINGWAK